LNIYFGIIFQRYVFFSEFLERWLKNSSFGFFSVGLCVGKKPNVLFVRLVSALQLTRYIRTKGAVYH